MVTYCSCPGFVHTFQHTFQHLSYKTLQLSWLHLLSAHGRLRTLFGYLIVSTSKNRLNGNKKSSLKIIIVLMKCFQNKCKILYFVAWNKWINFFALKLCLWKFFYILLKSLKHKLWLFKNIIIDGKSFWWKISRKLVFFNNINSTEDCKSWTDKQF